jgi:hypothetical protein
MAGSIFIPLITVFNDKGIKDAKGGLAAVGAMMKNMKGAIVATAAAAAANGISDFVKESVSSARDLESSYVGLSGMYGSLSPQMKQFTKDAQAIGLSQLDASRAVTFLGGSLSATGLPMAEVGDKTKKLIGIGADLAATFGLPMDEAIKGIGATFRGEYDPIERFGVAIKQAQVNALLVTRGQKGLTGSLLASAQAQARYDLLVKATAKSQGNYAKQTGSLYVQQQNLNAAMENMKASVGSSLTGPLALLLSSLMPVIELLGKTLGPIFEDLGKVITSFAPVFAPLIETILLVFDAITPLLDVLVSLHKSAISPLVIAFKILNQILKPIIPLIRFLAYVIGSVLSPILTVFSVTLDFVLLLISKLFDALGSIPFVGDFFKNANDGMKTFIDGMASIPDKVTGLQMPENKMASELAGVLPQPNVDSNKKALDAITKNTKKAAQKMTDLLNSALTIQKNIMSSADITGLLDKTSNDIVESVIYLDGKFKTVISSVKTGSTDLVSAFKTNLTKIKTFYANLNKLTAMGLDAGLIEQITSAGPDAGNATAEAIVASGKTGVTSLNKTFKEIKTISGNIGAKVATYMEKTGNDIGNGLIDGIKAQADALNSAVENMGKDAAEVFKTAVNKGMAGAWSTAVSFKSSVIAGDPGYQNNFGMGNFTYKNASAITNPFNAQKNPHAYSKFNQAQQQASQYNIDIKVAPGASGAQIGQALVNAIQEYERVKGIKWRQ